MTAIEIYPQLGQELVLDASDYCAYIRLGDVTIDIPGNSPEKRADWLMGFWENLTDNMVEYADKEHLTNWVRKATKQGDNQ